MKNEFTRSAILKRKIKITKAYLMLKFHSDDGEGIARVATELKQLMIELKNETYLESLTLHLDEEEN